MKKSMSKRAKIFFCLWSMLTVCVTMLTTAAFATTADPITVVNNLSDFIFSAIKAVGVIILGWGIVQVSVRRACDRLCQGNPQHHRRTLILAPRKCVSP